MKRILTISEKKEFILFFNAIIINRKVNKNITFFSKKLMFLLISQEISKDEYKSKKYKRIS